MVKADRAAVIISAAHDLFMAHGFKATTMEAIARAAGVAKPTLYARFPDKESVFAAVGQRAVAQFTAAFEAAISAPGPATDRVRAGLGAKYRALDAMIGASPHAGELVADYERLAPDALASLHATVLAGVQEVLFDEGVPDAHERAALVVAAVEGLRTEFTEPAQLARMVEFTVTRLLA